MTVRTVVIQCAKKTGDYAVLSYADLCVLALTHSLDVLAKQAAKIVVSESLLSIGWDS